ncbi:TPA: hypothetical protein ACUUA8_006246 [Pseudomonas aeruginosa]
MTGRMFNMDDLSDHQKIVITLYLRCRASAHRMRLGGFIVVSMFAITSLWIMPAFAEGLPSLDWAMKAVNWIGVASCILTAVGLGIMWFLLWSTERDMRAAKVPESLIRKLAAIPARWLTKTY